ncbi:uncharacterized protein LOC105214921 isoform X1 [Zeugodacus cucurbitae]|uniref:uncharacterized protein LOC105214921 isoform X1 n=1 Tax=Zeugodacus cucurbitae TaxID=28588 RepID=UPI0023D8EC41|nr:uncharacterized protein LOC105214921 isoform X1 [Zeugodacus cucurbitae]XP_054084383.1 uncharacterized protein LOC105214921 isoform X1 [Zeugodacus cucurbitae]XP_054084384.1 uncharacterized protein LOC105214921 isoform X1 [Zeugodacus cucurbitae]
MPTRRSGGATVRRKHSIGNLRRAHPASGATWNVQVVRGKMSSKCLWHACRALVLGLTLMLLGAGMATIGYYADHLSTNSELRGNATVRVKNDLKGFHLNNLSYVGPIVMGFGGFIVVASCVMTFEARDSAAKVVPARFRAGAGGSKTTVRSNQSSATSQRRAIGIQLQSSRWDQQFGVFRTSPAEPPPQTTPQPFDRDALTAELVKFSKSLSASARFSPQLRRLTHTGSVPNLSTHVPHPIAYSTNLSHLLSPNHKPLLLLEQKRHHRHHHRHHHHHRQTTTSSSGRQVKSRSPRISNSLVQRNTRENGGPCSLLQPPATNKLYWHAASFDDGLRGEKHLSRATVADMSRRSDTAKRHVLARQKPIEHEEDKSSPLGNRRSSTMSDSSYSGRWTARCASMASRASSIDSRRIQVDMHSPEVMPKSILRSPKRYSSGPSATPSVEKEFRSQLSVCSEPPAPIHQLSGQSSLEPCFPEEHIDNTDEKSCTSISGVALSPDALNVAIQTISMTTASHVEELPPPPKKLNSILKKARPDTLCLANNTKPAVVSEINKSLCRSNSSRTFYRPKQQLPNELDDSIFYIRSSSERQSIDSNDLYDSVQVINERRTTLLRAESEAALCNVQKTSSFSMLAEIPERAQNNSIDVEESTPSEATNKPEHNNETTVEIESEPVVPPITTNQSA